MRADGRPFAVAAIVLFFATRIPLLFLRQPFFDELFTRWIAAQSFGGILQALRHDSGPPLYYFLVALFGHGRILSLIFAAAGLGALLHARQFTAAILLALFPPAVLFSVDARAYALCAMFVTFGVLALDRDRPYTAAFSFLLAAYSHYYGVLFFPLVRRLKPALVYLLFLPGLWLALHQPREAIAWMHPFTYPEALFARPPLPLVLLMLVLVLFSGAPWRGVERWAIPSVLALPIYVPLRLESVVATPLMLWLARARRVVVVGLAASFATWTLIGIFEHAHRPPDPYRAAALRVRDAPGPVVASGYLYLYTALERPVIAFPPEQALHPGWRATATEGSPMPRQTFLWIGERNAPELSILARTRRVEPLYGNARAVIARVR